MTDLILLAEGDERDAVAALASFRSSGLTSEVHRAIDGHEALQFLFSERELNKRSGQQPALILLDLALPISGGLEVLRTIKADDRTAKVPVVLVLTSPASELDMRQKFRPNTKANSPEGARPRYIRRCRGPKEES